MGSKRMSQTYDAMCSACDCTPYTCGDSSRLEQKQNPPISCVVVALNMTCDMWPNGVRTSTDMTRFARLIVGPLADLVNVSNTKLPETMDDCFLYVSRGGCGPGTRLAPLESCVPDMMDELRLHAQVNNNFYNPEVAYQTGDAGKESWYESAQLSRSRCTCKINFGGEGKSKTRQNLNPDCQTWATGRYFEEQFLSALQQNSGQSSVGNNNVYMSKAFHVLLNRNKHSDNHRIAFHSDDSRSYVADDPITGMSWGATGVLLIMTKKRSNKTVKVLVSRPGDVYICGGNFQQKLMHAVPPISDWQNILQRYGAEMEPDDISAMEQELRLWQQQPDRTRYHINVRWHTNHQKTCTATWRPDVAVPEVDTSRMPSVAQVVQRLSMQGGGRTVSVMQPAHVFRIGTERPITQAGAVQVPSARAPWEPQVEPCVGDTRSLQSFAGSHVAPTEAKHVPTASVQLQTDEDMAKLQRLQDAGRDFTVVMAGCFSNVHFLFSVLRICHLAACEHQSAVEQQSLDQCVDFLKVMQSNLQLFAELLEEFDVGADIQRATSTLHGVQSALCDRQCLQDALHRLNPYGCSMYETRVGIADVQIKNQCSLRKYTISHLDCAILMDNMDINSLVRHGDIVWQMPAAWELTVTHADGKSEQLTIAEKEMLYVGFLDIGLLADRDMHRMHLRADSNKKHLRQDGTELAKHLKEFICRCAEHVRLLDYKRASLDRAADSPVHGYKMHVWAAPHQVRLDYLAAKAKANQQKREQIADTRQWNGWNASGWSDASGWRGSWNWSHNGWHGAWSQS